MLPYKGTLTNLIIGPYPWETTQNLHRFPRWGSALRLGYPGGGTALPRAVKFDTICSYDETLACRWIVRSMNPRGFPPRRPRIHENVNEAIRAREVRAVFPDGVVEVLPTMTAVRKAQELGLDLILVSPTAEPPVVKAMDYEIGRAHV